MYCLSSVSGGAVSYLRNMASLLAENFSTRGEGHSIFFLAHHDQSSLFIDVSVDQIVWIQGVRPSGYSRVLWEFQNLKHIVNAYNIDVLFTPYQISPLVSCNRHVLMLRNMEPFLFSAYHYSYKTLIRNHLLRRASAVCLRRADRVIAVSGLAREQLTQGLGVDSVKLRTIHHGKSDIGRNCNIVNDKDILGQIGVKGDFILTCGSLLPYRRCEDVIAAFELCSSVLGSQMRLVIAGTGSDYHYGEKIRRTIAVSPVRERIMAVGHVPWETMTALYRCSVVCVIATEIEACPNIAIEAMTAGCAIVSSDRAPLPEIFQGCSLEYRSRDIIHLAQHISRLFCDTSLRNEMKTKALKRANDFSWEKCARETYFALTQWA